MKLQTIIIGLKWSFIFGIFLCVILLSQVHNPIKKRDVVLPAGESLLEPVLQKAPANDIQPAEKLANQG